MIVEDSIVARYLNGQAPDSYRGDWIYGALAFEVPNPSHRERVARLRDKLTEQIRAFAPPGGAWIRRLFPRFDEIAEGYTIRLVIGFPDPYDAMTLRHGDTEIMVFDLIQFTQDALKEDYSCHRVLTHELIHLCLHRQYEAPPDMTYKDRLDYVAFDEGFAHALTYPEDSEPFSFTDCLRERYERAREELRRAMAETDEVRRREFLARADTGAYWEKFAAIAGKLYLLQHLPDMQKIYEDGWRGFCEKIKEDF